ncbi:hypothetical protein BDW22DRAFT_819619 [Trametopsis cervina]|nr:hypothetical protein BDW22DRAFT_819619 [Trametopsis cervina]
MSNSSKDPLFSGSAGPAIIVLLLIAAAIVLIFVGTLGAKWSSGRRAWAMQVPIELDDGDDSTPRLHTVHLEWASSMTHLWKDVVPICACSVPPNAATSAALTGPPSRHIMLNQSTSSPSSDLNLSQMDIAVAVMLPRSPFEYSHFPEINVGTLRARVVESKPSIKRLLSFA